MRPNVMNLRKKMAEVVEQHGEWTAMGIKITDDLSTLEPMPVDRRLSRITQVLADLLPKPLAQSRILDLACAEGHYAIECALHGAEVVAIEGRDANLAKVRFVKDALGLDRLSLHQDDVRHLSREKYGLFDVVICSGILYHLDAPDVFQFAKRVAEVCRGFAIIDTQIALLDKVSQQFEGREYWGVYYTEHASDAPPTERLRDLWASIDNTKSFWMTRPSLCNLLREIGFTTVMECHIPSFLNLPRDRITLVAIKGRRAPIVSSPPTDSLEFEPWPESPPTEPINPCNDPRIELKNELKVLIPGVVRRPLAEFKRWIRSHRAAGPAGPWEWREPWRRR